MFGLLLLQTGNYVGVSVFCIHLLSRLSARSISLGQDDVMSELALSN